MNRVVGLLIVNVVLIIILSIVTPHFLSRDNLIVLVDNMALEAIALSGYTLLLVSGNFDLSVDGVVALCGVIAGILMNQGVFWPLAAILALCVSAGIGLVNGIVVSKIGINGLIATLTTWWICVGISLGLTKALAPYNFPQAFQALGQTRIMGFRSIVVFAVIAIIVSSFVLHYTRLGAHIYVTGDNRISAEMMGIRTTRIGIEMYMLVGVLAGFIGLMIASRLNSASPVAVDGMALRVIAASVMGGVNLNGGRGTIIGGLMGLILMSILSNAVIQLGISPYWQKMMLGGILLTTVLIGQLKGKVIHV